MTLATGVPFMKNLTLITYDRSKISWYVLKTLHGSMNGAAYFARIVNYECKMLMKSPTGVTFIKLCSLSL